MSATPGPDLLAEEPSRSEPQRPGRRQGRGLGLAGWLRWAWRRLLSMRTALVLLLLLALAAIPGSVFPQRGTEPAAVAAWIESHPRLGPVLSGLGLFDVFASAWFAAIYLLLMISLLGCVIPRTRDLVRALRAPVAAPPVSSARFAHLTQLRVDQPLPLAEIGATLRARRWRVATDPGGDWLVAEKGYLGQLGNLGFHLFLLAVLVGVAVGSLFGWRGNVVIREGNGVASTRAAYDSLATGRLVGETLPPLRLKLVDFDATFEREGSQRGAPRSFLATLQYQGDPATPAQVAQVRVNHPLSTRGMKVYLLGHGYAPHLRVTDSTGTVVFDDTVVFLPHDGNFTSIGVLKAPDADPPMALEGLFLPTAAVDSASGPHSTFPAPDDPALFLSAWTGDLGLDRAAPGSVFSLDTSGLTQLGVKALRVGQVMSLPGGATVEFVGFDRWASFSVAHDPGKALALVSALAAILGLSMSLLLRRRRIWVRIGPGADTLSHPVAQVAGWDRRGSPRLGDEVGRLVAALEASGAQPMAVGSAQPGAVTQEG